MKKISKIAIAAVLLLTMVFALTACGGIDLNKVKGDWTISTVNGQSLADFAAANGVAEYMCRSNVTITDKTITSSNAAGSQELVLVQRANGVEGTLDGTTVMSLEYSDSAATLTMNQDVNGTVYTYVYVKGTSDLSAPAEDAATAEVADDYAATGEVYSTADYSTAEAE